MAELDEVFTPDEIADLNQNQNIRRKLLGLLTSGDTAPAKGHQLILGLLDGSDRSTTIRAKMRSDKQNADQHNATVKELAILLRNTQVRRSRRKATPSERTVADNLLKRPSVPGDTELGITPITVEQLIRK